MCVSSAGCRRTARRSSARWWATREPWGWWRTTASVIYLVSQPREPVGEPRLLELPAGKFDAEGEDVLATAKRELAEEIGKGARNWRHLTTFYASPGFSDEAIHVYLATDLYDEHAEAEENERIEIETVPLAQLDDLIRRCQDSKTLVGLLWLKAFGDEA